MRAGQIWAKRDGVPLHWWWKRPSRHEGSNKDADFVAESFSKRCCGVKGFFIKGAPCILKHNIAPSDGFANGTKGTMVDVIYKHYYQSPGGKPGELIKIEPPEYITMEVATDDSTTIVPCKRQTTELKY